MVNFGRGRHILEAMLICMCAGDEDVLSKIRMKHVVLKTEKHVTELPKFYFLAFKAVLLWIEYEIFPLAWKFRRFSKMPINRQLAYLETWERSSFFAKRNMFKLVKAMCVCHIYSEHKLLASIGYENAMRARVLSTCAPPAKPAGDPKKAQVES